MKIKEEAEDEIMHSGDDASNSLAFDQVLSNEPKQTSIPPYPNWQPSKQDANANSPGQQPQRQEQTLLAMDLTWHGSALENQQLQNDVKQEPRLPLYQKQPQDSVRQGETAKILLRTPRTTGVQMSERHSGNKKNQGKQISIMLLLPALKPHLDKDREMQLQTLFTKLRKNEIAKDQFVRLLRNIVGDQVLRLAVAQLLPQGCVAIPSAMVGMQLNSISPPFATQLGPNFQVGPSIPSVGVNQSVESNMQKSRKVERQLDSHGMNVGSLLSSGPGLVNQDRGHSSTSMQGHNKQQQHLHFPQTSFPMCGSSSGTFNPFTTQLDPNIQVGGSRSTCPFDGLGSSAVVGGGFPMPSDVVLGSITMPERRLIYRTIGGQLTFSTLQTVRLTGAYAPSNTTHITRAQADEMYNMYYALRDHWDAERTDLMGEIHRLTLSSRIYG